MGQVIIAGVPIEIDAPIVNWTQNGWDATQERCLDPDPGNTCPGGGTIPYGLKGVQYTRRYALRPSLRKYGSEWVHNPNAKKPPMDEVKKVIRQFVFHHDGCLDARMCWQVLQNERGLSCHFICDNDGTLYQTIDLALMAYHAAEYNLNSIGVEMSNRGDAHKEPTYYSRKNMKRDVLPCKINNTKILAFDFTPEQYRAMRKLCSALTRLLPNLPVEYPQDAPGQQSWKTLPPGGGFTFAGYVGHYHLTGQKWDPGPFDFKKFCESLRGERCFPLWAKKTEPEPGERPIIPKNADDIKDSLKLLYAMNEDKAEGGYFPVGPWGEQRLWHGGIHLASKEKQAIYSTFSGRIVAARMGRTSAIGSVNFVLVRHDMNVGTVGMRFFALYMHLYDESKEADPKASPPWMAKDGWKNAKADGPHGKKGGVVLLDEPIEAGEIIGRVGKAGPDGKAQIHFEIFAQEDLLKKLDDAQVSALGSKAVLIDGSVTGRFAEDADLLDKIDTDPHDGMLSRRELMNFYSSGGERDQYRLKVTYHVSEWIAEPDWTEALRAAPEFRNTKPADIAELVDAQITPGLFWSDEFSAHTGLPSDGVVYHFHPLYFLGFISESIAAAAANAPPPDTSTDDAGSPPAGVTADREGEHMVTEGQTIDADPFADLTFEQMVQGYDGAPQ
ncbi:MAG: N-acetylmuramoyl-L-alanine amidase [Deltaproteobacteria bacterium]|nr:N-acetylmuramoyl-L-alanine amidase [Deltaproteobacteria bacterium]